MLTLALVASLAVIVPALAEHETGHTLASLVGSTFEIDDDANLVQEDDGFTDWDSLAHPDGPEIRATDLATGQNDDSYKGGVKEDTECPGETTGSIPNNKSDLLTFHLYEEPGSPGFLNLAWSRVSDPSGTTLMDFEFNQSTEPCANGPNVVRTDGDLLIEYAIVQGGARAEISGRFWDEDAGEWGPVVDLDEPRPECGNAPCAVGTINQTAIDDADSDGLIPSGVKGPRTFGEAQIDLDLIFDEGECASFGSAMLKSRSSDSFTSQLKDFIAPVPIDLQNCGNVIIRKETIPDENPNATSFGYTKSFPTDPSTENTFSLMDDGVKNFNDDVLFGSGYTVDETTIPAGWAFVSVDCSASTGVTPSIDGSEVTFAINADTDVLDCTYTNQLQVGAIEITKTRKHAASDGPADPAHPGVTFTVAGGSLPAGGTTVVTDLDGKACLDGLLFAGYTVTETVPAGYVADGSTAKNVTVDNVADCDDAPYGGETVTFGNTPLTDLTISVDSQVDGGTSTVIACWEGAKDGTADHSTTTDPDAPDNGDGELAVTNLEPTDPAVTLTCEITVDP